MLADGTCFTMKTLCDEGNMNSSSSTETGADNATDGVNFEQNFQQWWTTARQSDQPPSLQDCLMILGVPSRMLHGTFGRAVGPLKLTNVVLGCWISHCAPFP